MAALEFQPRTDGYRVVRAGTDTVVASLNTRVVPQVSAPKMTDEQVNALATEHGAAEAAKMAAQYEADRKGGVTLWVDLPKDECSVHSAIGALTAGELREIMAFLDRA